jgi:hypothetical protein
LNLDRTLLETGRLPLQHSDAIGWEGWARTSDNAVNSRRLYQLSYGPMGCLLLICDTAGQLGRLKLSLSVAAGRTKWIPRTLSP